MTEYEHGHALGETFAEHDLRHSYSTASGEAEVRQEAEIARCGSDRQWRAFRLGIVRGYRHVARSYKWGRWGL